MDPVTLLATATACFLAPERLAPTQYTHLRSLPAEPIRHFDPDDDGRGETWIAELDDVRMSLVDDDGDGRADERTREIWSGDDARPDLGAWLDCTIVERWRGGRWHLVTVEGFDGGDVVTTTFRHDRRVATKRRRAITS